ncbi:MAG: 4-hydroxy-3-methylbut-2-enyl diphosphate reductase/S1 RNA-binding domain protein [bacterium ADurb.Bin425]|nr:MAG: 4-hydroxy-3-methylbut-2-enyl diphosphate reductase/S1 RNA-binding domain protein [bacterium ADurb.Bin425]
MSGLLHNREMADPVKEGDTVKVFVISAEMDGDKPRVALSTTKVAEQEQAEELLSFFGAGDRTTGRDIRAANIDGVEGFTMKIGQVATDAFLPASDANVKDTSVLTKGSRVARVVCTGKVFAGKYVQVTREDV